MLVLAQIPDASPEGIGAWLLMAACVLVLLNQGFSFFKNHIREEPRPAKTYAKHLDHVELARKVEQKAEQKALEGIKTELAKLRVETFSSISKAHHKMEDLIKELRTEERADIKGLQNNMTNLLAGVSRMEGQIEAIKQK